MRKCTDDMVNTSEFISLINARCILALQSNKEYDQYEEKLSRLINIVKGINKEIADELDEATAALQATVEELVYRQGIKDAINLMQ